MLLAKSNCLAVRLQTGLVHFERTSCSAVIVFVTSVCVTLLFQAMLPIPFQINESTDYTGFYEPVARNLLNGYGFENAEGNLFTRYPPGYPVLLASFYALAELLNISESTVQSGSIVIAMGLASVLVFVISRIIWGPIGGMISASAWMTYPFALWLTKQPNSEMFFIVVFYGGFCLFWHAFLRKRSLCTYFLSGLLFGLAMLIRPIAIGSCLVMGLALWLTGHQASKRLRLLQITMMLTGNLVAVLPWEALVYLKSGKLIMLSTGDVSSLQDGLTFAINLEGGREGTRVPRDVAALMQDLFDRSSELRSPLVIASVLKEELHIRPMALLKLCAIKIARSWYATDSQRFEMVNILIQIPYLLLILWASKLALQQAGITRHLTVSIWFMVIYFWGMTFLVLSILRYMVPAMGLLFVLLPACLSRWVPRNNSINGTLAA